VPAAIASTCQRGAWRERAEKDGRRAQCLMGIHASPTWTIIIKIAPRCSGAENGEISNEQRRCQTANRTFWWFGLIPEVRRYYENADFVGELKKIVTCRPLSGIGIVSVPTRPRSCFKGLSNFQTIKFATSFMRFPEKMTHQHHRFAQIFSLCV